MKIEPVNIGAVLLSTKARAAFPTPRMVRQERDAPLSTAAVQACPAVNTFETRCAEILSPFNLRLRCTPDPKKGEYAFHVVPDGTRLSDRQINRYVNIMPRSQWRDKTRPVIQISIPWFFVCDEICYVTQLPPYMSPSFLDIPGLFISGRFPTHLWPRSFNLAFEWVDFSSDLIIRQGRPISYVLFETERPEAPIDLRLAEMTPELEEYRKNIDAIPEFRSGAFKLFEELKPLRPEKLLKFKV
jgi:hypothetical protein